MECIDELLSKNRALQEELVGFLSFIDTVESKNEIAYNLSEALILTRQQARNKSARPNQVSVKCSAPETSVSGGSQLPSSLWCYEDESPVLSAESNLAHTVLLRVPPCLRSSFFWKAAEIQSLCCGVLSVVQQKLVEFVFRQISPEDDNSVEILSQAINECRKIRLDSKIANRVANELTNDDWQIVSQSFLHKRTPMECRIQWHCFVKPDRNQKPFSTNEATRLKTIAQSNQLADWEAIATELGTGRHAAECLRFYRQHFDSGNKRWSHEEDLKISNAWESDGLDALKILNIALGRDIRSVVSRSRQLRQKHKFKSGKWQNEEDLELLKSVLRNGLDWESVAREIGSRSPAQCRERFVYSIEPSLHRDKGSRWSQEDANQLKLRNTCNNSEK
eukprot:g8489.t2